LGIFIFYTKDFQSGYIWLLFYRLMCCWPVLWFQCFNLLFGVIVFFETDCRI